MTIIGMSGSVQILSAFAALAQALDLEVLFGKFIVVRELLAFLYESMSKDDDVLLALNDENFADTVGIA